MWREIYFIGRLNISVMVYYYNILKIKILS